MTTRHRWSALPGLSKRNRFQTATIRNRFEEWRAAARPSVNSSDPLAVRLPCFISQRRNYSMTTPTTASPPKKQRQKVRGQPPCSFTTTRQRRWSALPGFSETNKSKPKQMATDAAADTLPSRSDRDGLFDKPAETSWIPTPPISPL
jgi:hypothetical protein